jgi:hypothetical protein
MKPRESESGFALIVAIIALVLLTFLGLTLTLSTSTETQIARNYSWSRQAYFNAQAGAEVAKNLLKAVGTANGNSWASILPVVRNATNITEPPTNPATLAILPSARGGVTNKRDWEGYACDKPVTSYPHNAIGYGLVLTANGSTLDYVSVYNAQALSGAFTVWIRRLTKYDQASGKISDKTTNDEAILTIEGVAPYTKSNIDATPRLRQDQAVQIIEVTVTSSTGDPAAVCGDYAQGGGNAAGTGQGCSTLDKKGVPGATENQGVK